MSARRHPGKRALIAAIQADPAVIAAVGTHAAAQGLSEAAVWRTVRRYLHEIIPTFNPLVYRGVGHTAAATLLRVLYRVTVVDRAPGAARALPPDAIVIYLMNHRSNADYVVASYALSGQVAISWAVGEWARVFPLEYLFKSFGSYFIRRRYREPLYHTVLERYVHQVTSAGVTQGLFPEGGLTRDGRLRPSKIGLLDYIVGAARDPALASRMFVVPVGLNYDRVLEDRTLLRELRVTEGETGGSRWSQVGEVVSYLASSFGRLSTGRWQRYGRAAVVLGAPVSVAEWVASEGDPVFDRPRGERLAAVQRFCDRMMGEVGRLVPVTAVPLVCAALQTFEAEYVARAALLERVEALRAALEEAGAVVAEPALSAAESFERAYRLLRMRRVLSRAGEGYLILPRGRELVSYYANGIAHLCGEWEASVRSRDALPVDGFLGR
ncbi:MAG: 1-acyl-sn-glycerol-3-phosphate acyltransferase [Gemmatimonadota bacterium]|nr:1-acyl-sn-glycerol-3-phosphate acyltransferase [Gemmatimonadota bacterium]